MEAKNHLASFATDVRGDPQRRNDKPDPYSVGKPPTPLSTRPTKLRPSSTQQHATSSKPNSPALLSQNRPVSSGNFENQKFLQAQQLFMAKDYSRAYPIFDELSKGKNVGAMYYKAVMLLDGLGVAESNREGLLTLKRVFEVSQKRSCDPEFRHLACYQIGLAYAKGTGTRQDMKEALRWWERAANEVKFDPNSTISFENQLNTEAGTNCQILLANHFSHLQPAPDWDQSYFWHKEAAQNGSVESMLQVGLMAWHNLSCHEKDDNQCQEVVRNFLGQAAQLGNVCAMANLAMYCLEKQLQEGAFFWATKAVECVSEMPNASTLGNAVTAVMTLPGNENDEQTVTKCIAMAYFVLAHLHNVGAVATKDKAKAEEFYETASNIDLTLVRSLSALLESETMLK